MRMKIENWLVWHWVLDTLQQLRTITDTV